MDGKNRFESKIGRFVEFSPIRFFERGEDHIHAAGRFKVRFVFAAFENLERREVFVMGVGVKYFHVRQFYPRASGMVGGNMDIIEAIHSRHSVKKVKQDSVSRELIETLLSAAVQAPNHHCVRPWRFVVLTGDGRKKLGDVMAESFLEKNPTSPPEGLDKQRALPLRAPVLIAIGVDQPTESNVLEIENFAAASAAAQNILLAAHALGLGAIWRTGKWASDSKVKEFLGFSPDQHIAAFLYIGYPEMDADIHEREGYEDRVRWIES